MNLLSPLMPGVRQVRTPLAVGSLWLVALYLAISQGWGDLETENAALTSLSASVKTIPLIYVVGALAFIAYLIGSALQGLSVQFGEGVLHRLARLVERAVLATKSNNLTWWRRYIRRRTDQLGIRSTVMDAVSSKYADAAIPPGVYLAYPFDRIILQLGSMAVQLSEKASDQYQEWDRLKAESAFRIGISLPLAVIGVVLGWVLGWWWIPVAFVPASIVLAMQARGLNRERQALLANALYQRLIENATLNATVRILSELDLPTKMGMPEWYAATSIALDRAGDIDGSGQTVSSGASELSDDVNFESKDWKGQIDGIMDRVRRIYRTNSDESNAEYFERQVAMAQKRAEAAIDRLNREGIADGDSLDWATRRAWQGRAKRDAQNAP